MVIGVIFFDNALSKSIKKLEFEIIRKRKPAISSNFINPNFEYKEYEKIRRKYELIIDSL